MASLAAAVAVVDAELDAAERALQPFLSAPLKSAMSRLSPLDTARLSTALAFSATSLLYGA
jgi:hypothetical protein